jgi:ABC-type lipoprotein release transport system permease subunit
MFGTYLRRELVNRRKQTIIIAIGMALAIALVIIVNAVSVGIKDAQGRVLQSIYGVGTDVTITQPVTAADAPTTQDGGAARGGRGRFDFGAGAGATSSNGTRTVHTSRLEVDRGTQTLASTALAKTQAVSGVKSAAAVLSLTNTTFDGTLPNFQQQRDRGGQAGGGASGSTPAPTGGSDGAGGSSFTVDSFTVMGINPAGDAVGPLSAVSLSNGRTLTAKDAGKDVAVLDASYAKKQSVKVGGITTIGGKPFTIVGLVTATGSQAQTASNAYIPLDVAQTLSSETGKVTSIYVTAESASDVGALKTALEKALPRATVSTQADLASSVSGSLGTAGEVVSNLGTWLSLIVLAAAFLIAILFTVSGVTRRTREFGTLKAIGWTNRRIVGQVAGESVVQGLIGGVIGVAVGLIGVLVVNLVAPTLSGSAGKGGVVDAARRLGRLATEAPGGGSGAGSGTAGGFGGGGFGGRGFGAAAQSAASSVDVTLHAPITVWIILIAVGLAVLGGLLAGAIGGWRASRLRPAEALRSVA